MKTIVVNLTEKQLEWLGLLVEDSGLNRSEHIRRAIDNYLENTCKRSWEDLARAIELEEQKTGD